MFICMFLGAYVLRHSGACTLAYEDRHEALRLKRSVGTAGGYYIELLLGKLKYCPKGGLLTSYPKGRVLAFLL